MPYAVLWGILAVVFISFISSPLEKLIAVIPIKPGKILLIILFVILLIDLIGTIGSMLAINSRIRKLSVIDEISEGLQKTADLMGEDLTGWILKHLSHSYPNLDAVRLLEARMEKERQLEEAKEKAGVFAVGCSFYKLTCLFFLGAFLGDITETIFCYITTGKFIRQNIIIFIIFCISFLAFCKNNTANRNLHIL